MVAGGSFSAACCEVAACWCSSSGAFHEERGAVWSYRLCRGFFDIGQYFIIVLALGATCDLQHHWGALVGLLAGAACAGQCRVCGNLGLLQKAYVAP